MNGWLFAVVALLVLVGVQGVYCAVASALDGLVALEVAGIQTSVALLLLSEGTKRQPFADLAIVSAVAAFVGTLVFAYVLQRKAWRCGTPWSPCSSPLASCCRCWPWPECC